MQRSADGFPCVVLLIDVDKGGQPAVFKYSFEPVGGVWVKHRIFLSLQWLILRKYKKIIKKPPIYGKMRDNRIDTIL